MGNIFESLTIFVMASNETDLLRKTVLGIRKNCSSVDLEKIFIVAQTSDCLSYYEGLEMITENDDGKLDIYVQKAKQSVECLFELPSLATSSHFIIMAADMEMDPSNINEFIEHAKENPEKIICASKWIKGSVVEGYGKLHALGSRFMNKAIALLYGVKANDLFSPYQIYPVSVYNKMKFNNPHRFMYEYTLKPIRLGVKYEEISTVYRARTEGKSSVNLIAILKMAIKFCFTALRIRFTPKRYF